MKQLLMTRKNNSRHWVGDGFPVRSIFSYNDLGPKISPFLLMDYAGPAEFPPTTEKLGVGEHPHRGFETVTIVYAGEVEHRDSAGGGGIIRSGDVQWMTAASGLVHEEFHGKDFARSGGRFEMVQLWVNLPSKFKMHQPRYQGICNENIPSVELPNAGSVRVIAGEFRGAKGPANTFSPIDLWDVRLKAGADAEFKIPKNHTTSVFVLRGEVSVSGGMSIGEAEIGVLDSEGDTFSLKASQDTVLLVLSGQPINEPIVGYGPFVMNTVEEIQQAFHDFQSGKMGALEKVAGTE